MKDPFASAKVAECPIEGFSIGHKLSSETKLGRIFSVSLHLRSGFRGVKLRLSSRFSVRVMFREDKPSIWARALPQAALSVLNLGSLLTRLGSASVGMEMQAAPVHSYPKPQGLSPKLCLPKEMPQGVVAPWRPERRSLTSILGE